MTATVTPVRSHRALHSERSRLDRRAAALQRLRTTEEERDLSDALDPEHPRPAIDATELTLGLRLERQAAARVAEIDAAFARLADGTYGRCEMCDATIPAIRLLAIPETRHCLPCRSRLEQGAA